MYRAQEAIEMHSRYYADEEPEPTDKTRFDYARQAWIQNGVYIRCGHPDAMNCTCYGRIHEGEPADQARAQARTGCGRLTHVEGTNGGQMPCGARLTTLDGQTAPYLCAACAPHACPDCGEATGHSMIRHRKLNDELDNPIGFDETPEEAAQ